MKLEAKNRLIASTLTLEQWKAAVSKKFPKAKFTLEDGSGSTYGEKGDWCAHDGPDMQSDVVGVFTPDFCSIEDEEFASKVEASLSDPISNGVAFDTMVDGDPSQTEPEVQELTHDDGGVEKAPEQELLMDYGFPVEEDFVK